MNTIGPAAIILKQLLAIDRSRPVKVLLHGAPGCGKTTIAEAFAENIGGKWDIESVNGRNVTIDLVREWQHSLHTSSMFSDWKVKIINEADLMTAPAQDLMLSVLDELPVKRAVICTSNVNIKDLSERFRTRFVKYKVDCPKSEEIANLLCDRGLPPDQSAFISVSCSGNVRAALNDADVWFSEQRHAEVSPTRILNLELLGI